MASSPPIVFKAIVQTVWLFYVGFHPASEDCFRIWSHLTRDEGATQVHTFDEDINSRSLLLASAKTNMKRKRVTQRGTGKPGVGRQLGGIAPLLAAILPTLAAGGKAAAIGGANALANYGAKKALKAAEKNAIKGRRNANKD